MQEERSFHRAYFRVSPRKFVIKLHPEPSSYWYRLELLAAVACAQTQLPEKNENEEMIPPPPTSFPQKTNFSHPIFKKRKKVERNQGPCKEHKRKHQRCPMNCKQRFLD